MTHIEIASDIALTITKAKQASKNRKQGQRREAERERYRKALRENPQKALAARAKKLAQRLGVPFDLSPEDLVLPCRCPAYDIALRLPGLQPRGSEDGVTDIERAPALIRIDPAKGFVSGNVVVTSTKAARDSVARSLLFSALRDLEAAKQRAASVKARAD